MRRASGLLSALALLALSTSPAHGEKKAPGLFDFQTWKTPAGHQRDQVEQLAPGRLDLTPAAPPQGPVRTLRLRIHADSDYRSTVLHWQRGIRAHIDRVNRVVEPVFNVRFQIEELRPWERSHVGAELDPILRELEVLDPARDVDLVVALVTPFRGLATSVHQIGWAHMLSRHFVLRGMDDEQESLALDREFNLLRPEERQRVYSDRKAHKETVVFLHEWGHVLGAQHNEDPAAIMNPAYDVHRSAFSDFQKELLTFVLGRRLARPDEASPERDGLAELLKRAPSDEGTDKERAALLTFVMGRGTSASTAAPTRVDGPAPAVVPVPVAATYGPNKRDPRPILDAAAAYVRAEDLVHATPLVLSVGALIGAEDADSWVRLGLLAQSIGAYSQAEAAVEHAGRQHPDSRKLIEEIERHRMRIALPREAAARWAITREREPSYVSAFWEAARVVAVGGAPARARVQAFADAFPGCPGAAVLACEMELNARHSAVAAKSCQEALDKFPQATRALYLLGLAETQSHRSALAETHLRKAVLLDPWESGPWRELGRLYRATHANQRLAALAAQHEALLASPLPE